jgi:hypothetical protein
MISARFLIFGALVSSSSLWASSLKYICRSEGEGSFVRLDRSSLVFVEGAQAESLTRDFASRGLAAMAPFVYSAAEALGDSNDLNFVRRDEQEEVAYRFRMRSGSRRLINEANGEAFVADFEVTRLRGEVAESLADARLECVDGSVARRRRE